MISVAPMSLLAVFFLLVVLPPSAVPFEPVNREVQALVAVKTSLFDPHGVLSKWDQDSVDPCSWAMVTCSANNSVTALEAPSQNLSGTLSGRIADLRNLQQMWRRNPTPSPLFKLITPIHQVLINSLRLLQDNNITGAIPPELGKLEKLQTLDLSGNSFTGDLPSSLGHLTGLHYMRLNNNTLSGSIPPSLSKLPDLSFLDLSFNNLSGPLPLFPARTFNVLGNPSICGNRSTVECSKSSSPVSIVLFDAAKSKHQKIVAVAVGSSIGSTTALVLLIGLLLLCWRKRRLQQQQQFILGINDEEGAMMVMGGLRNLRRFGLRELQAATDGFNPKNILGKGGFGNVYRGRLGDGTVVAVKRLKDVCSSGEAQFRTEVEMISLAVHRNLLRLVGYCATANERILVYPFMSNGSVASRLRAKPTLDWNTRKRIALGTARGLLYLHDQCDPKIIHRDVKAANVLLDDFCEAVVGDFGLAKLLDHGESHVTTAVRGTAGHIAPEYLFTGQSSDKTDVFGFGILLLELVSGLRVLEYGKGSNQKGASMLDWVRRVHHEKKLELIVDRDLRSTYDPIEVGEMLQVALLCTQYLPSHRPKMSEVVRMLEGDGLAEKWEASNPIPPLKSADRSDAAAAAAAGSLEDDDDGKSLDDVEEMELSGPR